VQDHPLLDRLLEPDAGGGGPAVAAVGNLDFPHAAAADELVDAGAVGVGIDVQVLDPLADDLVDGRHGVAVDGEPADGDVRTVLHIGPDGLGQGHDFIRSYIHGVSPEKRISISA